MTDEWSTRAADHPADEPSSVQSAPEPTGSPSRSQQIPSAGGRGGAAPRIHAQSRDEWRSWLHEHHASAAAVWLVSWKKNTGKPAIDYDAAVTEALAVGWVDSKPATLDQDRTMLYFSPRKKGSGWSRPNKNRVLALRQQGLLTAAGEKVIHQAQLDGSWSLLDDVENLIVPTDLAAELDQNPPARANWDRFPPSTRRGILEWIVQAKRPSTRERRVRETARLATMNQRANQWPPRSSDDSGGLPWQLSPGHDLCGSPAFSSTSRNS